MDSNQVIGWTIAGLILPVVAYAVIRIGSTRFKELPPARRFTKSVEYLALGILACLLVVGVIYFMGSTSLGTGLLLGVALVVVVGVMLLKPKGTASAEQTNATFRIAKDGEDLGDIDLPAVKLMLKDGRLNADDYYFDHSVGDWLPIRSNKRLV